jgi:tRNA U34 5-methylaminomethyl-2-thiouridine-forming methyltransferase MnmC
VSDLYHIVRLANGAFSLRSEAYGETFHPVIGPAAEAQALYVEQLDLVRRVQESRNEFVVWDVGLGGAANPLTFLRAIRNVEKKVKIISFDYTLEPLQLALKHSNVLTYLNGWETTLRELLHHGHAAFSSSGGLELDWQLHLSDFPSLLKSHAAATFPKAHAIFFDAFSPATNPSMWTLDVFSSLYQLLDPNRLCLMPTYSRSTMLRVTLLLAGFFVGKGHSTGEKEETTIAANLREGIISPLDHQWLIRCKRSRSAEPLVTPEYRQSPISESSWQKLSAHPQFCCNL